LPLAPRLTGQWGNNFFKIKKRATMKTSSKTEIVISTWSNRTGPSYWGDHDYGSHDGQSTSFWVSLRGVVPSEPYRYLHDDNRAINDLGLYVWVNVENTVCIDLRLHVTGSLTLYESEQRVKVLRRLLAKGKAYRFSDFSRESDVQTELTKALDALGVKRSLVYHGVDTPDTYVLVGIVVKRICDEIEVRLERLKQRQAA